MEAKCERELADAQGAEAEDALDARLVFCERWLALGLHARIARLMRQPPPSVGGHFLIQPDLNEIALLGRSHGASLA